jgi:hypothetical protein
VPSDAGVWLTLQTCPPNTACDPGLVRLALGGAKPPGSVVPEGSFARLRVALAVDPGDGPADCRPAAALVTEVASFGGVTHADAKARTWLLAASNGFAAGQLQSALGDVPFTAEAVPVEGCPPPLATNGCCDPTPSWARTSAWAIRFTDRASAASARDVIMGQLVEGWAAGEQRFDLYNAHASFHCGCDEIPVWAFWAAQSPAK